LVSAKLGRWELYNLDEDRSELNDLSGKQPERVTTMAAEWFRIAEHVDRLKGRALSPVRDEITSLSFRKDTSSDSAANENRKKRKK
jgi:arylsulfatase